MTREQKKIRMELIKERKLELNRLCEIHVNDSLWHKYNDEREKINDEMIELSLTPTED